VKSVKTPSKHKDYKRCGATSIEDSTVFVIISVPEKINNDSADKRCEIFCELLETFVKHCTLNNNSITQADMPKQPGPPPTCYKCGVV